MPAPPELTERFQRVLAFAADEADGLGHAYVDNRHLLYALSVESRGIAHAALERVGITSTLIHEVLAEPSVLHDRVEGQLEASGEVQTAIERAADIAVNWGDRSLDTGHLLYAILIKPSSLDELLNSLNVPPNTILEHLYQLRDSAPPSDIREEATYAYRLTLESGWVLSGAATAARRSGMTTATSLHLLVALMQQDTVIQAAFSEYFQLDVAQLAPRVSSTGAEVFSNVFVMLSQEVQTIVGFAIGEAWNRGHQSVRPVHILMGLTRLRGCSALEALAHFGVSQFEVNEVADRLLK